MLPDWLDPLADSEQMRATDRWASDEQGIDSLQLMERAGHGLVRVADAVVHDGLVVVVCGAGNNGGDGYVAARLWRDAAREVRVLMVGAPKTDDAKAMADKLYGDKPKKFKAKELQGAALIVDALLGTGVTGKPSPEFAEAIAAINAHDAPVVAADVPSGIDASTGEVEGEATEAVATATFAAAKPGLWIAPGKQHAGEVKVIDIGIPRGAPTEPKTGLITPVVLSELPSRGAESTKFESGRVAIAGGSRGLTGAVCLAAEAAQRAGAGYVTAFVPASLEPIFEAKLTEPMTIALPDDHGDLNLEGFSRVAEVKNGALVLGPGLGKRASDFATTVAEGAEVPLLIDADGLNAFAGKLSYLKDRGAATVLTPHAGELARLLETKSQEIGAHRLHYALEAARISGAIVVLKGDDTIVATPEGVAAISGGGSPALATAGTGDVLSGTIGALLASGADAFVAACAGVWIHAEAGRLAATAVGHPTGVIASDVIAHLPHARARGNAAPVG